MAATKAYYVYIMTNANNTVLYTGATNNLARQVYEHKNGLGSAFMKSGTTFTQRLLERSKLPLVSLIIKLLPTKCRPNFKAYV